MVLKLSIIIYTIYLFHTTSKVNGAAITNTISECNFEHGLCPGYEINSLSPTVQFLWELNSGATQSDLTGPNSDYTKKDETGQYIYAESTDRLNGDVARLTLSVNVKKNDNLCLTFAYHMYGHTMGDLSILIRRADREETLFHLSQSKKRMKNKEDKWRKARVPLISSNSSLQIIFQSKTSYSYYGDMAIDDIKLSYSSLYSCYFFPYDALPDNKRRPTVRPPLRGPDDKTTCGQNFPQIIAAIGSKYRAIGRVIRGIEAKRGEWPWMAMLLMKTGTDANYQLGCGGTLIGTQWIITAAHCVAGLRSPKFIKVRLGVTRAFDGQVRPTDHEVDKVFVHPDYRRNVAHNNDIALMRLKKPQKVDNLVNSICLTNDETPAGGAQCYIAGWGKLSGSPASKYPQFLQHGRVALKSHDECVNNYGNLVTDRMLCAGNPKGIPDTCEFDSGGPLMCKSNGRWSLVGITSWGHTDGCGKPGNYGVYTNVRALQDWLKSVTKYPHLFQTLHYDKVRDHATR